MVKEKKYLWKTRKFETELSRGTFVCACVFLVPFLNCSRRGPRCCRNANRSWIFFPPVISFLVSNYRPNPILVLKRPRTSFQFIILSLISHSTHLTVKMWTLTNMCHLVGVNFVILYVRERILRKKLCLFLLSFFIVGWMVGFVLRSFESYGPKWDLPYNSGLKTSSTPGFAIFGTSFV